MKIAILLTLISLALNDVSSKERITITGSSTVAPVISDLAKAYESTHRNVRVDVQTGGSSRGILDARRGSSQIGMVSRSLKIEESDLHSFILAKDGLAIITHKDNKIAQLSESQIKSIFLGKISNWKQVGGEDKRIVVVNKAEGRSTLELFLKFFKLKNSLIKADIIIGDNEQGIKTVSRNKNAIAYVSVGAAEYNVSQGVSLKLLPFRGVKPSVANVANSSYPLIRELNLVTKTKPMGELKNFINFAQSKNSFAIIREHYFVPIKSKK